MIKNIFLHHLIFEINSYFIEDDHNDFMKCFETDIKNSHQQN